MAFYIPGVVLASREMKKGGEGGRGGKEGGKEGGGGRREGGERVNHQEERI